METLRDVECGVNVNAETGEVLKQASILEFAGGAVMERANAEFEKVIENIMDLNTEAKAKRELRVKFVLQPTNDRKYISAAVIVTSKLAPLASLATAMRLNKQADIFAVVEDTPDVPGQVRMDGSIQEQGKILQFKKNK